MELFQVAISYGKGTRNTALKGGAAPEHRRKIGCFSGNPNRKTPG